MRLAPLLASLSLLLAPCVCQASAANPSGTAPEIGLHNTSSTHLGQGLFDEGMREEQPSSNGDWNAPEQPPQEAAQPVPEPSTLLLVGSGLVGLALSTRVRRRRSSATPA